ncbi:MAG: helix-turn-helix transcriptional regulator [Candidatus Galacturonibacter soehngenii]|nr:helix-turn-helix transcriptional regulator [Candidatus Galacturonibacter soehngenii]
MYRNLKTIMVQVNISEEQLSKQIGITKLSLRNKMNGITDFKLSEVYKIKSNLNVTITLEELFKKE